MLTTFSHHVKSDLDPYVCLFENCGQEEVLYNHAEEWLSHMREHAKFWHCSSHRELGPFSTRELYIAHLREVHHSSLSDLQLRALANRKCRKETKLFKTCPLCGYEDSNANDRLEDHITGHLRSIALKSLPSYAEDIPDYANSTLDSSTSQPQSRSTIRNFLTSEDETGMGSNNFWDTIEFQITDLDMITLSRAHPMELDPTHQESWVANWRLEGLRYLEPVINPEDDLILHSLHNYYEWDLDSCPEYAVSDEEMAFVYENQDRSTQIEEFEQMMEIAKTKLGAHHPNTLSIMADLVTMNWGEDRFGEAEKLQVQMIEIRQARLGADHPDTLSSIKLLSSMRRSKRRREVTDNLEGLLINSSRIKFDTDQPDTQRQMVNRASTCNQKGSTSTAASSNTHIINREDFTIGWLCVSMLELLAAQSMLDHVHSSKELLPAELRDYTLGQIQGHNVVIACMAAGHGRMMSASKVAKQLIQTFKGIRFGLMVGIGGGAPSSTQDIRLGDVVVSHPSGIARGLIQFDYGKILQNGEFKRIESPNAPPQFVLNAIGRVRADHRAGYKRHPQFLSTMIETHLKMNKEFGFQGVSNDCLFQPDYEHASSDSTCEQCDHTRTIKRDARDDLDPVIHYGTIASGNRVIKDAMMRDRMSDEHGVLCFDLETGESLQDFPHLVVRGIYDYADSHSNNEWQGYAAATAAAFAKELLSVISPNEILQEKPING